MSVKERDPLTGHQTTGHEWNGITELNTRVPRAVWFFIAVTHIWALVYWVLMPAWPLVTTYTKGLLGYDDRTRVERQLMAANAQRADWTQALATLPAEDIRQDPALMARVAQTAPALFGDNCAACHGSDLKGQPDWQTQRADRTYPPPPQDHTGHTWQHSDANLFDYIRDGGERFERRAFKTDMPGFGDSLNSAEIWAVIAYVKSHWAKEFLAKQARANFLGGLHNH